MPVLRAVFDEIRDEPCKSWAQVVARNSQSEAAEVVRRQLETAGWLSVRPRRRLGVIPTTRLVLRDEALVGALAYRVTAALRRGIAGEPADERSRTLGLLGGPWRATDGGERERGFAPLPRAGQPYFSRHSTREGHARGDPQGSRGNRCAYRIHPVGTLSPLSAIRRAVRRIRARCRRDRGNSARSRSGRPRCRRARRPVRSVG